MRDKPMNSYKILFMDDEGCVVMATSYLRPFDDIEHIEVELSASKYRGGVLFDLLLCNGISVNRYMMMDFDGEKFDYSSLESVKTVSESAKTAVSGYIRRNDSLLIESVLPNAHRYLIRQGNF